MIPPNPWIGRTLFALDSETHLIQPGLLTPPGVCGSWANAKREGLASFQDWLLLLKTSLSDSQVIVGQNIAFDFGVAAAADPSLLPLIFDKYDRDEVFDTGIAEQLIDIHRGCLFADPKTRIPIKGGYSLALLAARYLGLDVSADKKGPDAWRLRYALLESTPITEWPEEARAYPIRDARYTYDIAVKQIEDGRNLHDLPDQARAAFALHLASVWGVRTDRPWVEEFCAEVTAKHTTTRARFLAEGLLKVKRCAKDEEPDAIDLTALQKAILLRHEGDKIRKELARIVTKIEAGDLRFRYSADKKAIEARVSSAYQGEPPRSAKKNTRTDKDTLWESGDALLSDYADEQENEKFFVTYLDVLRMGTRVPINPSVNVLVDSGRTSYRKPNLQNLPRGGRVREGFCARPGTAIFSCDYPTLELRTLAFALETLVGESRMADALRAGVDLHTKLAAQILGVPYPDLLARVEAKEKQARDFRQMAKAANFGLPGGLGPFKLVAYARQSYDARFCLLAGRAERCGVEKVFNSRSNQAACKACVAVAYEIRDTWFKAWPEMEAYFALVKSWLTDARWVQDPNNDGETVEVRFGPVKQLVSGRVRGDCNFTNAANTIFQGLAADIAKRALWLVSRESYTDRDSPLWGARAAIFIHDEIWGEAPIARAPEAAERVAAVMDAAFGAYCPTIPCKTEPAIAFRWYKDMYPTRDAQGRLLPVEKCGACRELVPADWNGQVRAHARKDGATCV